MIPRIWAVLLFAGTALSLQAQTQAEVPVRDPTAWVGMTPETAYRDRGAPAEVFPLAIDDGRWQVVHFYPDHSYLFWSSNRVWQVRLDRLWPGSIFGISMGAFRSEAETTLGEPVARGAEWSLWNLPYKTFPRRLRLVFSDGLLVDAYLYRSDL